ncbi:hypothetical protein [Acetivibrio ethanolgignens]|uniref:Glyoxalase/fosfomycin resistance/dioxygenase domain-containing protein n=1 Tax=Acetivibrio ethanolgignens TaxID=290052 RepID=A0A0V8QA77_9FIRM|nr:hypothetical protein [Acetivibrio ethanolgignens]KSV57501.1 hypothetical protein ASU35_04810 [Acetivibrio ethanolgignens]
MINMRHVGIYVKDIIKLTNFYINCFEMLPIVLFEDNNNRIVEELFGKNIVIKTTKLLTPYGKKQGTGDMIELVQINNSIQEKPYLPEEVHGDIGDFGSSHIAIGG